MTPSSVALRRIGALIQAGGIGAYPTEGVYGLGCDPLNEQAIARVIALKGRADNKGLIVIAASQRQLDPLVAWPEDFTLQADPRPVTWVVPAAEGLPPLLTGGRETIAVRVTNHPPVIALCNAAGMALVSTSANRSGRPACRYDWQIRKQFRHDVEWILPAKLGNQRGPSEIREAATGRVLRPAGG